MLAGAANAQNSDLDKAKAEYEKRATEELGKYELKGLRTSLLLNKGIFTEEEVEYYRHLPRNASKQIEVSTTADQWKSLYERLVQADLRD